MEKQATFRGPLLALLAAYAAGAALLLPKVRWQINPDGVSYIEIAERYAAGEVGVALSAFWSPLFSWLLTPLLIFGIEGLVAAKLVTFAAGAALLVGLWLLSARITSVTYVRVVVVAALIPTVLEWSTEVISPDLVMTAILIFCLVALFPGDGTPRPRRAFLAGLLGGLAYLAKSYALPFVLSLLVVVAVGRWVRAMREGRAVRSDLLSIAITTAGVFAVALPWIVAVSIDAGRATIGTAGSYNLALTGPGGGPFGTHDHPIHSGGLSEPASDSYTSTWSDPPDFRLEGWSTGQPTLSHAAALIRFNLGDLFAFLWRVSPLTLPILLTGLLVLLMGGTLGNGRLVAWLLASGSIYAAGYLVLHIEGRYLWLLPVLLLAILAAILDEAERRFPRQRRLLMVMATVIALSFWIPAIGNIRDLRYVNRASASQATELRRQDIDLSGKRVASDARWDETLYLGYHADFRYFGVPADLSDPDRVRRELDEHRIDAMLVWGSPRDTPSYLEGWRRVTLSREVPFSVFER